MATRSRKRKDMEFEELSTASDETSGEEKQEDEEGVVKYHSRVIEHFPIRWLVEESNAAIHEIYDEALVALSAHLLPDIVQTIIRPYVIMDNKKGPLVLNRSKYGSEHLICFEHVEGQDTWTEFVDKRACLCFCSYMTHQAYCTCALTIDFNMTKDHHTLRYNRIMGQELGVAGIRECINQHKCRGTAELSLLWFVLEKLHAKAAIPCKVADDDFKDEEDEEASN